MVAAPNVQAYDVHADKYIVFNQVYAQITTGVVCVSQADVAHAASTFQ